ncbi:MAG: type VI secretion system membrane subunit TssM [Bryobacteraceae bacterium]|jgi:type VI secretion system protein ImpL
MGFSGFYLLSAVFMVVFIAISWIVTGLLHLSGTAEMIVRVLFMGLAFSLFGLVYWWRQKRQRQKESAAQQGQVEAAAEEREIESFVRDAEVRLAASMVGKEAKLGSMPVYFLIGETGAAKTSLFVHSGVEPELLAGQVYQDNNLVPTRPVNIWLAQKSVFVEAGGRLLGEPGRWMRLVKRLQPRRRRLFFRPQPPRGVIVCVDSESFLKPGADEAVASTARNLQARLGEISHALGIRLPIYVLFSKLDRLGFFTDFVGNLTEEEVHQTLGVTLPIRNTRESRGVYAEEESRRLTAAFDGLFHALCDKRLPFLARENDASKLPAVYEFPREYRKLRNSTVRFLVDLGRPSQLRVNPFLRGFYFSGVRPVVVKESMPAARVASSPGAKLKRGATGFFEGLLNDEGPVPSPSSSVRTRRTPQWLFLGHLFSDVILRDRAAMGASAQSVRAEMMRRILAAAAAGLFVIWSIGMTVSYFRNRALESRVEEAARGIGQSESGGAAQELPSTDSLTRLDTLRESVELLSLYDRQGAPWSLRWGLYVGSDLYPAARRLYFSRFQQLLFGSTQTSLLEWLRKLPAKPGPNDEYKPTYDTLKAYLITTSHHEKSTRAFLPPLLYERWAAGRQIDADRAALARKQFDFYADELLIANPFSSENEGETVEAARSYLAQFNAVESIYQFILAEATRQKPAVNFNRQFKGSAAYVINNHDVPGAFTIDGWKFVDNAISNVKQFFGGEAWVLGEHAFANLDPVVLGPQLRSRYHKDYIANWRAYLAASEVVPYRSIADAALKLSQLSSNQSYLLGALCLASINTNPASLDEETSAPYQPVQYVMPPACTDRYIQDHNGAYTSALVSLQSSMDRVAKSGTDVKDDLVSQTEADATAAYKVTRQIAQNFRIDREGNVHGMVQKFMEDPIRQAEAILGRLGPAQLNTEGRRFCGEFAGLTKKYPFDTNARVDATLDDINGIFRPGEGKLATFFDSTLKNYVERRGNEYVRRADSRVQVTDAFLRFLNRATALGEALYKNGAKDASLTYNMKALPAEGLKSVTLSLDGQVLTSSGAAGESKDFTWPGSSVRGAKLSGNLGGGDFSFITYDGLWAAFRFFGDADRFQSSGAGYTLQWVPRQGQSGQPMRLDSGKALALPFLLDLKGAPPIFQKGYLSGFQCVSEVAR